ncbi:FkbM family methyltransferase [Halorubrum vacuolatum]|uniref:Methyltransferase, FkbM family n=1 Tax=Halorubrum vacuolatum TaxID=63740 RepID=A0A238UMX6_HALVU|nr:FkbM family methyltransferase [Halorubrum vacuolatum]SNR23364.1 methyltransferase, FkbM family [Halorubrum vacuolatum]
MDLDGRRVRTHLESGLDRLGVRSRLRRLYWALEVPSVLYRLSPRETIVHEIDGHRVEFPTTAKWQYERFRFMHPEYELFEELSEELAAGDVFYDIGAHLGWHAVVAAAVVPNVTVEAFEPHPAAAAGLREVVAATGHDIRVHEIALDETNGTAEFTAEPTPAARLSTAQPEALHSTIEVETATGDHLVNDSVIEPPDIIKIDAEGADAAVLRGLEATIDAYEPRVIYCEIHVDGEEIREFLTASGYEYEPVFSSRPVLRATPA